MANIRSEDIKVFPSVTRNDEKDRNARLNSEANIISLTNRLTGSQSYIINGLDLSEDGSEISAGRCCIYGYYFDINSPITNLSPSDNVCYLHMSFTRTQSGNVKFLQLNGDNSNIYMGLEVLFGDTLPTDAPTDAPTDYYLLVATKNGNDWVNENDSRIIKNSPFIIDDGNIS